MKANEIINNKLVRICFLLLIVGCQTNFKKHELLIDFSINSIDLKGLREIKAFEELGYLDQPREIEIRQNRDTLVVKFTIFEGAAPNIEGNIEIKKDSLFLRIGRGVDVRELMIHEYQYKIYNPDEVRLSHHRTYGSRIRRFINTLATY